ncbi:MAG: NAD(P)-binding domain-containing protein [Candidatus Hodarchaeales archaeon]
MNINVYLENDGNMSMLRDKKIGIIGYGNKAKAIALNMRDQGLEVLISLESDDYEERVKKDKFEVISRSELLTLSDYIFLYEKDDVISDIFETGIKSQLKEEKTLIFASGYTIVYDKIQLPSIIDVLLVSPRVPGVGIRENYLKGKGFFSFIGVHQDVSGEAKRKLLALTQGIGGLTRAALEVSFKQQIVLELFSEQTFAHALTQMMMRSVSNLMKKGYPPEAIFVELFLSGEGGYTVDKMIEVGFMKQMNYHSQTSQYGQISRGTRFLKVGKKVKEIQQEILKEIEDGSFVEEWDEERSKIKLQLMRYHGSRIEFADVERRVRENLGFPEIERVKEPSYPLEDVLNDHDLKTDVEEIKDFYKGA